MDTEKGIGRPDQQIWYIYTRAPNILEFGTLPPKQVFKTMRAEGWLHHHDDANHPKSSSIKNCLLHAFYPNSSGWKDTISDVPFAPARWRTF